MYLNKTAELTEQIILVPHIIEMSCRITQRKGDKDAFLQTPEMSLASFAFFPFPNYWTAKSSRCNWKLSKRVSMMARAAFVAVFNERGSLEPVNIAGSIPADRKWRCGLIANSFRGSSWEELLFFIFYFFFPQDASSAWTSSFLSVGTPVGVAKLWKKNTSCPVRTTLFGHWSHLVSVCCRCGSEEDVLSANTALHWEDSAMKQDERKLVKHKKGSNLSDFRGYVHLESDTNNKKKTWRTASLSEHRSISGVYLHFNNDKMQSKSEPTQVISCDGEPNVTTKGITGDNSQAWGYAVMVCF